jgi:hypothetical protein
MEDFIRACDLYDHFEYIRQPLNPHDTLAVEAGPSGQIIDHPIDQVIDPTATSAQVHINDGVIISTHTQGTSIVTPTFTHFHSTNPSCSTESCWNIFTLDNADPCQIDTINFETYPDWGETTI